MGSSITKYLFLYNQGNHIPTELIYKGLPIKPIYFYNFIRDIIKNSDYQPAITRIVTCTSLA